MDDEINDIIKLYKALTGGNIIPKDTDPKRTYQYRYAAKFLKNMKGVPWETIQKIVYCAIEYAKENEKASVYSRGLWILTKSNIVDIAYKKAKEEDQIRKSDLVKVVKSKEFANEHDYKFSESVDGGFPNVVAWYDSGKISLTYLAMSESCKKAFSVLDEVDKRILPNQKDIVKRRIRCLIDTEYKKQLKDIMGTDYIKIRE